MNCGARGSRVRDLGGLDGELRRADGALLFIRVASGQDVRPLDWVTSRKLLEKIGVQEELGLPTQVMLCELIRFLEISLANHQTAGARDYQLS